MEEVKSCLLANPLTTENKLTLRGFVFRGTVYDKRTKAKVFVFNDEYRKLNIDLLFTGAGRLFVTDPYGETMDRETIEYIFNGN